jgi:purine-binding chemotaxis protein CheW
MTEPAHAACDHRLICSFWLDAYRFGVDAAAIREVSAHTACTPIPLAPPAVRGYVNLRGHLYLVLDLPSLVGLPASDAGASGYLIVFQARVGESVAVFVDRIGDMVAIGEDRIDRPKDGAAGGGNEAPGQTCVDDLVVGIARLDDGLLTILEPRRFLPAMARGINVEVMGRSS